MITASLLHAIILCGIMCSLLNQADKALIVLFQSAWQGYFAERRQNLWENAEH